MTAADLGGTAVNVGPGLPDDYSFVSGDNYFTYTVVIAPGPAAGHKADASGPGWDAWYIWDMPQLGTFIVQARDVFGNALNSGGEDVAVTFNYANTSDVVQDSVLQLASWI